jgi:hypothetical protein
VVGDFVAWANNDAAISQKPAVVGLARYLMEHFPCPKASTALAGNAALGAGIGAGAGLAGGLLTNAWRDNQERSFQQGFQAGQQSR